VTGRLEGEGDLLGLALQHAALSDHLLQGDDVGRQRAQPVHRHLHASGDVGPVVPQVQRHHPDGAHADVIGTAAPYGME